MSCRHASFPTGRRMNTCYCAQFTLLNTCLSWRVWKHWDNKLKACQETHPTGKQDMDTGDSHHVTSRPQHSLPTQTLFTWSSFTSSQFSQNLGKTSVERPKANQLRPVIYNASSSFSSSIFTFKKCKSLKDKFLYNDSQDRCNPPLLFICAFSTSVGKPIEISNQWFVSRQSILSNNVL